MNDLDKIETQLDELGLEKLARYKSSEGGSDSLQLLDFRGENWEVIFHVTETECNVIELNYDNVCVEQSNETVPTLEEALKLASTWC